MGNKSNQQLNSTHGLVFSHKFTLCKLLKDASSTKIEHQVIVDATAMLYKAMFTSKHEKLSAEYRLGVFVSQCDWIHRECENVVFLFDSRKNRPSLKVENRIDRQGIQKVTVDQIEQVLATLKANGLCVKEAPFEADQEVVVLLSTHFSQTPGDVGLLSTDSDWLTNAILFVMHYSDLVANNKICVNLAPAFGYVDEFVVQNLKEFVNMEHAKKLNTTVGIFANVFVIDSSLQYVFRNSRMGLQDPAFFELALSLVENDYNRKKRLHGLTWQSVGSLLAEWNVSSLEELLNSVDFVRYFDQNPNRTNLGSFQSFCKELVKVFLTIVCGVNLVDGKAEPHHQAGLPLVSGFDVHSLFSECFPYSTVPDLPEDLPLISPQAPLINKAATSVVTSNALAEWEEFTLPLDLPSYRRSFIPPSELDVSGHFLDLLTIPKQTQLSNLGVYSLKLSTPVNALSEMFRSLSFDPDVVSEPVDNGKYFSWDFTCKIPQDSQKMHRQFWNVIHDLYYSMYDYAAAAHYSINNAVEGKDSLIDISVRRCNADASGGTGYVQQSVSRAMVSANGLKGVKNMITFAENLYERKKAWHLWPKWFFADYARAYAKSLDTADRKQRGGKRVDVSTLCGMNDRDGAAEESEEGGLKSQDAFYSTVNVNSRNRLPAIYLPKTLVQFGNVLEINGRSIREVHLFSIYPGRFTVLVNDERLLAEFVKAGTPTPECDIKLNRIQAERKTTMILTGELRPLNSAIPPSLIQVARDCSSLADFKKYIDDHNVGVSQMRHTLVTIKAFLQTKDINMQISKWCHNLLMVSQVLLATIKLGCSLPESVKDLVKFGGSVLSMILHAKTTGRLAGFKKNYATNVKLAQELMKLENWNHPFIPLPVFETIGKPGSPYNEGPLRRVLTNPPKFSVAPVDLGLRKAVTVLNNGGESLTATYVGNSDVQRNEDRIRCIQSAVDKAYNGKSVGKKRMRLDFEDVCNIMYGTSADKAEAKEKIRVPELVADIQTTNESKPRKRIKSSQVIDEWLNKSDDDNLREIDVDLVITMFNPYDSVWKDSLNEAARKFQPSPDALASRRFDHCFECMDCLKGISKFAKFYRNLYIVVPSMENIRSDECPEFLKDRHRSFLYLLQDLELQENVYFVTHTDLFGRMMYSSQSIEFMIPFIGHTSDAQGVPPITEFFVYLNDDMVLTRAHYKSHYLQMVGNNTTKMRIWLSGKSHIEVGHKYSREWERTVELSASILKRIDTESKRTNFKLVSHHGYINSRASCLNVMKSEPFLKYYCSKFPQQVGIFGNDCAFAEVKVKILCNEEYAPEFDLPVFRCSQPCLLNFLAPQFALSKLGGIHIPAIVPDAVAMYISLSHPNVGNLFKKVLEEPPLQICINNSIMDDSDMELALTLEANFLEQLWKQFDTSTRIETVPSLLRNNEVKVQKRQISPINLSDKLLMKGESVQHRRLMHRFRRLHLKNTRIKKNALNLVSWEVIKMAKSINIAALPPEVLIGKRKLLRKAYYDGQPAGIREKVSWLASKLNLSLEQEEKWKVTLAPQPYCTRTCLKCGSIRLWKIMGEKFSCHSCESVKDFDRDEYSCAVEIVQKCKRPATDDRDDHSDV